MGLVSRYALLIMKFFDETISRPCKDIPSNCVISVSALSNEKNDITHAVRIDGLKNAQKIVRIARELWKNLRQLLQKSTASVTSEEVRSEEIDVTK